MRVGLRMGDSRGSVYLTHNVATIGVFSMGWTLLVIFLVVIEIYYWFVYVPKAWKNESNNEINDIKRYAEYVKGKSRG